MSVTAIGRGEPSVSGCGLPVLPSGKLKSSPCCAGCAGCAQGARALTDAEIEALARELVGNSAWNLPGEAHE